MQNIYHCIKEKFAKIDRWQREGLITHEIHPDQADKTQVTCMNCNTEYEGKFCPQCGQSASVRRFTLKSVLINTLEVWGMGNRSLPRTILHLFLRPGYMIGDYLDGHRMPYFQPVKSLFVLCIFLAFTILILPIDTSLPQVDDTSTFMVIEGHDITEQSIINFFDRAYNYNRPLTLLLWHLTFVLLTMWIFRKAPARPKMTFTENICAQIYISCQLQFASILWVIATLCYSPINIYPLPNSLIMLLIIYDYKQLFGYGWLQTVFRVIAVFLTWLLIFILIVTTATITAVALNESGVLDLNIIE